MKPTCNLDRRFIIEGFTDDGDDGTWTIFASCDDAVIAKHIFEAAENFLQYDRIEVWARPENDAAYTYISMKDLRAL
jgi:hypothetical protein